MVKALAGEEFQIDMAKEMSYVPNQVSLAGVLSGNEGTAAMAAGAANGHATPNSPNWAAVEAKNLIKEYMTAVLTGGDAAGDAGRPPRPSPPSSTPSPDRSSAPAPPPEECAVSPVPAAPQATRPRPRTPAATPPPRPPPTAQPGRPLAVPADRADRPAGTAYLLALPAGPQRRDLLPALRTGRAHPRRGGVRRLRQLPEVLGGAEFWTVVRRTLVWTAVNVVLIMVISTAGRADARPGSGGGCGSP